jgi:hypothetical protein
LGFDYSLGPHFEDMTTKTTGLRFPRPYRTVRPGKSGAEGFDMGVLSWFILGLIAGFHRPSHS